MKPSQIRKYMIPWGAALVLFVVFSITGRLYEDYDNYNVAIVINGLLGNNNFCQYQHPLLCLMLRPLNILLPWADSFTLFTHLALIAALSWMIFILRESFTDRTGRLVIWAGVLYLSWSVNIWNVNYTVQGAFLCFAGLLGIFSKSGEGRNRSRTAVGTLFYALGFMMRIEAALLFVPFILLAVIYDLVTSLRDDNEQADNGSTGNRSGRIKRSLGRFLPLLVCFVLLAVSLAVFKSVEPYKSGYEYDKYRRIVSDFPMSEWDDLINVPNGVDKTIYRGAMYAMYADTDLMSEDSIAGVSEAGSIANRGFDIRHSGEILTSFVFSCLKDPSGLLLTFIFPVILLIMVFIRNESAMCRCIAILSVTGAILIFFFFFILGRAPMRVWHSILLACLSVLVMLAGGRSAKTGKRVMISRCLEVMAAVLLFVASVYGLGRSASLHPFTGAWNAKTGIRDTGFSEIYDTDMHYLVCGWNEKAEGNLLTVNYLYGWYKAEDCYADQGKLPERDFFRHYISSGQWFYGQEYYMSLLRDEGLENPVRALFEKDNIRLLDMSEDTMFREYFFVYMYDHYGEMTVKKVGSINGYPVYEFRR